MDIKAMILTWTAGCMVGFMVGVFFCILFVEGS